ncbi:MAG: ACT domain-containing protein [Anaerolineae bacterium]
MQGATRARSERIRIGGILFWCNLARLGVMNAQDRPGLAAEIFATLGRKGINVPFIVQNIDLQQQAQVVFCVAAEDSEAALEALKPLQPQLGAAGIIEEPEVAIVAIFGPDFRERAGIAGTMFAALASAGINILAISTSISTVSCLIRQEDLRRAMTVLEATFELP